MGSVVKWSENWVLNAMRTISFVCTEYFMQLSLLILSVIIVMTTAIPGVLLLGLQSWSRHHAVSSGEEAPTARQPPVLPLSKVSSCIHMFKSRNTAKRRCDNSVCVVCVFRNEIESQIRQVDREIQQWHDQYGPTMTSMPYGKGIILFVYVVF